MSTMANNISSQTLWESIKGDFQSLFPHDVYRTWFEPMGCLSETEEALTLSVPNEFAAIWVQDNYVDLIIKKLQLTTDRIYRIYLKVKADDENIAATEKTLENEDPANASNRIAPVGSSLEAQGRIVGRSASKGTKEFKDPVFLNPRNTFANFVVGPGNQLAHAASIAVANAPAMAYNPLFLYGDTGLGKTHLMHAVAHHVIATNSKAKIAYISTEKFTNEFIHAIQDNSLIKFRQRYRNVDVLLIDDIHFLSGKERIQEEFFHTFNELFEAQKQIFLCSDRPASEIAKLESRLISRFQWGLVTDIQAPDLETRLAILAKKAQIMKLHLSEGVLQFLAERVCRNVRRMEGALTRIAGYAALVRGPVDVAAVERLLQDILQEEAQNRVSIDKIQSRVADYYKLRLGDMVSKRRPANIAFPRQIAMYLCRVLTTHSLQEIGESFGGRDHGTVIHACKTVENIMEQDESVKRTVEYLQKQISKFA